MTRRRDERGMVLLLVLVITTLLAALLSELAFSTLVDLRLTETFRDGTRAYYLAKGGITVGRMAVQQDNNSYDAVGHVDELWARGVQNFPVADGSVSISAKDLDGRLNLNLLVDDLDNVNVVNRDRLQRLAERIGMSDPETLVDALIDWIDSNDEAQAAGAEAPYYARLERPHACKNGPLDSLDELVLIKGVTKEDLRRLSPHVTVFGDGKLNVNSASRELLGSWDIELDQSGIEELLALRSEAPITSLDQLKEGLGIEVFTTLNRQLDLKVTSRFYQLHSQAVVAGGVSTVVATLDKQRNSILLQKVN